MDKCPASTSIDDLERFGWVDALRRRPASSRWATARRQRDAEVIDSRTDYLFASPRLADTEA